MAATAKRCSGDCGDVLELGAFAPATEGKLGRDSHCRPCRRIAKARRIARQYQSSPLDRLLAALKLDRVTLGKQHSTIPDVFRVIRDQFVCKECRKKLQ